MSNEFETVCDDFYLNMRLGSQMALPQQRETVLHFFEQAQKAYPDMTRFRKSDQNEYTLEEDRSQDSYRWIALEPTRIASGHVNPPDMEEAIKLHSFVLEQAPYQLGLSTIEVEYLDVLLGFDLLCVGNHDEVVAEVMYNQSPMSCLLDIPGSKPTDFQPTITVALSPDLRLQARVDIVTRTTSQAIRTGEFSPDMLSVYMIVRRYWGDRIREPMGNIFGTLTEKASELAQQFVIPKIIQPLRDEITSRS